MKIQIPVISAVSGGRQVTGGVTRWTIGDDEHIAGTAPDGCVLEFYYQLPRRFTDISPASGNKLTPSSSTTS